VIDFRSMAMGRWKYNVLSFFARSILCKWYDE